MVITFLSVHCAITRLIITWWCWELALQICSLLFLTDSICEPNVFDIVCCLRHLLPTYLSWCDKQNTHKQTSTTGSLRRQSQCTCIIFHHHLCTLECVCQHFDHFHLVYRHLFDSLQMHTFYKGNHLSLTIRQRHIKGHIFQQSRSHTHAHTDFNKRV